MLSRRNIRIKILQILYAREISSELSVQDLIARYRRMLDDSFDLYLFTLYILMEVSRLSINDAQTRAKKHLPTAEDKVFVPRLFNNDIINNLEENEELQHLFHQLKFSSNLDQDIVKQIYLRYSKEEDYIKFASEGVDEKSNQEGILDFFRFLRKDELFEELLEDKYHAWLDDKSLIIGTMKKTIKLLPSDNTAFFEEFMTDVHTSDTFGLALLTNILDKEEIILSYIKPKLINWEADRLANIDMIILKMAVSEMMQFSTIPTKATINEYVEVAKTYSTDKSKEFVNGILDTLMRELTSEGIIVKSGRGLK